MKPNQFSLAIVAITLAAAVTVVPLAVRGCLRYYALNKVLRLPQAQARLKVKPTRLSLTDQAPVQMINLGYAVFDAGSTNHLFIEARGGGASVMLTNRDIFLVFLPPFASRSSTNLAFSRISAREARAHPNTFARMNEWETNLMAAEMAWEETQPLPLSRILLMNGDDFLLYSLKVTFKAGSSSSGSSGVEFFQSPFTKGIVRIGQTTNDSRFAAVYFASLDSTKNVGLLLRLPSSSSQNLSDCLPPLLRSFRFTAEKVDDKEAIKGLIRRAGISQRKEEPADE